jgi:hypothetical protein
MRRTDAVQVSPFIVAKLDKFVPADHPLSAVRLPVNEALTGMNTSFNRIYP